MRSPVITGMGAVSGLGFGAELTWRTIESGRSGIRRVGRFVERGLEVPLASLVAEDANVFDVALAAAREAIGSEPADALVLGTTIGDDLSAIHRLAEKLGDAMAIEGPRLTVSTACSSSTAAIGLACELVLEGAAKRVIAGGADVLSVELAAGFRALGVLSDVPCTPLSVGVDGTTLGEGAAFVVVEAAEGVDERSIEAHVLGHGLSADAHHETTPHPRGRGVATALRAALADAGLSTLGYVNVHGTGTASNDVAECFGVGSVVRAATSSCKAHLGHAQGAAGALELVISMLATRDGKLPPTHGFRGPRPSIALHVVGPSPEHTPVDELASLSSAFGGSNAALIVSRRGPDRVVEDDRPRRCRDVWVSGLGVVTGAGREVEPIVDALLAAMAGGRASITPACAPFAIDEVVRTADPRGMDPTTRLLVAATALAMRDAGLSGRSSEKRGLFFGSSRAPAESLGAYRRSIDERSLMNPSAHAFARLVVNAPAGACARALGLRGPSTTISTGRDSGVAAFVRGARWLRHREDAESMMVAAADERDEDQRAEGAACLVLSAEPGLVRVREAVTLAPGSADEWLKGRDVDLILGEGGVRPHELIDAESSSGMIFAAAAIELLRRGAMKSFALVASGGRSADSVVILERHDA